MKYLLLILLLTGCSNTADQHELTNEWVAEDVFYLTREPVPDDYHSWYY